MASRATRWLGALILLAVGLDHLDQYSVESYSVIPTIGALFLANFVAATVVAAGLVAPRVRPAGRALLALGGIAIAAGSVIGLLVSESSGLFGFMEQGYRPAIVVSLVLEAAAVLLLGAFLVASPITPRRPGRASPGTRRSRRSARA